MNTGNTAFMMICTALVFFMTPGLAFFYGGLVRRKNVCNTMMACVAIMGLSVLLWTMFGYSLSFGGNHAGIIGDFRWAFLNDVGWEAGPYADTIPHLVFAAFQMMFAMITPALITGAVVGRMRFKALFAFIALWSFLVYYPMAHMVWGEGGFLAAIGSVDFEAEMWYTSVPASVPWFSQHILAEEKDTKKHLTVSIIFLLLCLELPCSGSDGLDSMQEVPWRQMDLQPMHL